MDDSTSKLWKCTPWNTIQPLCVNYRHTHMIWMSFSSIMLKEIVSKDYLLSESFVWHPRKGKPIEVENKSMVSRSWAGEEFDSKGAAWSCSGWGSSLDPNCCCSVAKSCPALCDPVDYSTPALHCLLEFAQTHVHRVDDALQPSHTLLPPSPPGFNLSHHQCLFQWVNSLHQVANVLEHQHQSFQWIFRVDFL